MRRREERLAVRHRGVRHETLEEKLIHKTRRTVAHRSRHLEERTQVIVDDHLARQAELLRVGVELVDRRFFCDSAILDFSIRANGLQIADVGEAVTLILLEVGKICRRAEFGRDDRLRMIRLKKLLLRDIGKDAGKRHRRKRGLDCGVVERARNAHPLKLHALGKNSGKRHISIFRRRFDGLFAHRLGKRIAVNSSAQRKRRFDVLCVHGLVLLDGDIHISDRLLLAESRENRLVHLILVPALGDGLSLNLGEFAVADRLDHRNTLTFNLDGFGCNGLHIDRRTGSRSLDGCRRFGCDGIGRFSGGLYSRRCRRFVGIFRFHYGVSFQFEFRRDLHVSCLIGSHRDHGHLAEG